VPLPGPAGLQLIRAAHRAWRAVGDSGQDQVVDHVLLDPASKKDAREVLSGPGYVWVGIRCDVDEVVRRETARGDRFPGFASGTSAVVHDGMTYDLELDVTRTSPAELAERLHAEF
jgi:chloramphenicol 3-O phosphotransferase